MSISAFRSVVWPLAVAETIVWAALYYSFPALLLTWESDLGWSKTELSGALTLAIVVSAFAAPWAGRLIDRGGGRLLMAGSALAGAACLALLATVQALWQFYLLWLLIGIAMAGMLYDACFAFLTHVMGPKAKQAITLVTLVAGFAGTLSFPACHVLVGLIGWRGTVVALAGVVVLVALPLLWFGCGAAEPQTEPPPEASAPHGGRAMDVLRLPAFWLLAFSFAMIALDHSALLTHLLPLLASRGIAGETAVFAAAMIGPMQVAGRLAMMAADRHVATLKVAATAFIAMGLGALFLLGAGALPVLLVGFVLFHGAGVGVTSITRPVVIAELLGRRNFGMISGLLAMCYLVSSAAAPTVAALVWGLGGYDRVIEMAAVAAVLGFLALLAAARMAGKRG